MHKTFVSVIIPTHNRSRYLCEAIDSVLVQTYKEYEIIVVDNGSTDDTKEALKKYGDQIRYFYSRDNDLVAARNFGFAQSQGAYIGFLDDDDIWMRDKLEKQVSLLEESPRLGFVCSQFYVVDAHGTMIKLEKSNEPCTFEALYDVWFVGLSTTLVRRDCLTATGLFDQSVLGSEAYDMWLRLAKQYPFTYMNLPLAKSRVHDNNASKNWQRVLKSRVCVVNKKEIAGDMSFLRKRARTAKVYYKFGVIYASEKNYYQAFINYMTAIAIFPFIGMYYWPAETKKFRFSLPYRIIKAYFVLIESLAKGLIQNIHVKLNPRFK